MKTQIFHYAKIVIGKNSSKRNQNLSRHYNSIINLKFQHKPKYHLSKIHIKINLLLPRGQNPLSYYTCLVNPNTISLPCEAKPIKVPKRLLVFTN
jgi:hypothetical protein